VSNCAFCDDGRFPRFAFRDEWLHAAIEPGETHTCGNELPEPASYARDCSLLAYNNEMLEQARAARAEVRRLGAIALRGPLNRLSAECHAANQHWWHDPTTGARLNRNRGELLCLIHSEISECMEGERKNLPDDKLPHRRMAEVELADALIRIFDYAGAFGYDLDGAVAEKREFNAHRADHKAEARLAPGGKAF